jgi:hypothetical protein
VEYLCTTCCKEKRLDEKPLPAVERYLSPRIRETIREGRRSVRPVLILSGRYGLLDPQQPIPWYDQALTTDAVDELVPRVIGQLRDFGVSRLVFQARDRSTVGWEPYYRVLETACRELDIELAVTSLD